MSPLDHAQNRRFPFGADEDPRADLEFQTIPGLIDYAAREIGIDPAEAVGGYFKPARDAIAKAEGRQ